ncbi:MAG: hypothetical protein AAFW65_06585 [Pseudomonadota bacterium]
MRRGMIAGLGATLLLGGCVLRADHPHNDVLLFATSTEIGLDVEASVQNAGIPDFTIGYERDEGVWMPLRPNGLPAQLHTRGFIGSVARALGQGQTINKATIDAYFKSLSAQTQQDMSQQYKTCSENLSAEMDKDRAASICLLAVLPPDKYVSMASGVEAGKGGSNVELDTYSVFASFGARGEVGENKASGGIAQFFATGIAAQRLGANPQVGIALNTAAPDAIEKRAAADEQEAKTEETKAMIAAQGKIEAEEVLKLRIKAWDGCGDPAADNANFIKIVDATKTAADARGWLYSDWAAFKQANTLDKAKDFILEDEEGELVFMQSFVTALEAVCK